jgi:DNA-binding transcriptional regulator YdaS (Cro superfamily)
MPPMIKAPIDLAIDAVGSLTELARRLKIDPQVIVNWRKRGIPALRVLALERATVMEEGEQPRVSRHQLRPDLYPEEARAA